jgi:hypothetical protein
MHAHQGLGDLAGGCWPVVSVRRSEYPQKINPPSVSRKCKICPNIARPVLSSFALNISSCAHTETLAHAENYKREVDPGSFKRKLFRPQATTTTVLSLPQRLQATEFDFETRYAEILQVRGQTACSLIRRCKLLVWMSRHRGSASAINRAR